MPKKTTSSIPTEGYRAINIDEAHARNQQNAFTGSFTLLGSTNKAPVKDTVVPKEESKATGEQENESIGTVTTIVTEPQELLSVSSSASASTIGLGLGAYVGSTTGNVSNDLKRWGKFSISYIISLGMIQSGSFISYIYEWGKELVLDVPDAEDLIESIPLLGESTTIISSPPLEEKYYRESVSLIDQETIVISNPLPELRTKESLETIPLNNNSSIIIQSSLPGELSTVHKLEDDKPIQRHHYLSDKHKIFTPQYEEIIEKYGLSLADDWNIELLPHQGRHTNYYHEYILERIYEIDDIAQGDRTIFLQLFEGVKNYIRSNHDMMYKEYWRK